MKNVGNIYTAEKGNFIVRKRDNFIMGEEIDLGSADSIENYEEQPYTKESYEQFYLSLGYCKEDIPKDDEEPVDSEEPIEE